MIDIGGKGTTADPLQRRLEQLEERQVADPAVRHRAYIAVLQDAKVWATVVMLVTQGEQDLEELAAPDELEQSRGQLQTLAAFDLVSVREDRDDTYYAATPFARALYEVFTDDNEYSAG